MPILAALTASEDCASGCPPSVPRLQGQSLWIFRDRPRDRIQGIIPEAPLASPTCASPDSLSLTCRLD